MTLRARVLSDPRVQEVSDERHLGSGVWIYLNHGWCDHASRGAVHTVHGCVHSVHEDTWTAAYRALRRDVGECDCADCRLVALVVE